MKCIYTTIFDSKLISFNLIELSQKAKERFTKFYKRSEYVEKDNLTYTMTEYGCCIIWYGKDRSNKLIEVFENGVFNILHVSKPNLKFVE